MNSLILNLLALASTALSNPIDSAIAVPAPLPAATFDVALGTAVGDAMSIQSTLKSVFVVFIVGAKEYIILQRKRHPNSSQPPLASKPILIPQQPKHPS
jgi:hypothetical protein